MRISSTGENLRALRFKSSYVLLKRPPCVIETPYLFFLSFFRVTQHWTLLYKLRSVQNTVTCHPGLCWICQVHQPRFLTNQPWPGKHVPIFCTDLDLFYSIHFPFFFNSSVGLVGNFARLPPCRVPSVIVRCNQNEAGHQIIKAPSMTCWGAAGPWIHFLAFMHLCHRTGEIDR